MIKKAKPYIIGNKVGYSKEDILAERESIAKELMELYDNHPLAPSDKWWKQLRTLAKELRG